MWNVLIHTLFHVPFAAPSRLCVPTPALELVIVPKKSLVTTVTQRVRVTPPNLNTADDWIPQEL